MLVLLAGFFSVLSVRANELSQSWVPVVVLTESPSPPLRASNDAPVVLGFAKAQDIRDGLPLQIGWYVLDPNSSDAQLALAHRLDSQLLRAGDFSLKASSLSSPELTCLSGSSPLAQEQCRSRAATELGLRAELRRGPALLTFGLSREEAPASMLPNLATPGVLRLQPDIGTRVYTRDSLRLGGALNTELGEFGVGMALNRMDLGAQFGQRWQEGQLSVSWLYGNLGGTISGRSAARTGTKFDGTFAGLDLGLIWRTPWNGIFSLGARNALRAKASPEDAVQPLIEGNNERVPYVRYEQDL